MRASRLMRQRARNPIVSCAIRRLEIQILGANMTANAEAGFGARDVEEAGAVGGADPDILDRGSLCHRQVGGLNTAAGNRH